MQKALLSIGAFAAFSATLLAQNPSTSFAPGRIMIPGSNLATSQPGARRFHTDLRIMALPTTGQKQAAGSPPYSGYLYETPASIACIYNEYQRPRQGCNPNIVTANPVGGSGAIALVDAYDDPTAEADLQAFSQQFGLPSANFSTIYAAGTKPSQDPTGGWEIEESLDIEWAHAMAPNAQIILVEAASNYDSDLLPAVQLAAQLVAAAGGGEVSMSWGGGEFSDETLLEGLFSTPGVVFFRLNW